MHYKIPAFELLGNHNAISLLVREFQMQIVDILHYLFPIIAPLVGRGGFYVLNTAHKGIKINRERDCAIAYRPMLTRIKLPSAPVGSYKGPG